MSRQLQKLIQRLNTLEREIREIRKEIVVTQEVKPSPDFPVIKQQQQVEQVEQQQQQQQVEQQLAAIKQTEQE